MRFFEQAGPSGTVLLAPVTSRGDVGRAELTIDGEAAGEVGVFLVEAFCRIATPEARAALLRRLGVVCGGEPDPGYGYDGGAAPRP
jgi:hypothetical protein